MSVVYQRKYGEETVIAFELYNLDGQEHQPAAPIAAGDTQISKNEGNYSNTANVFVLVNSKTYKITLTALEMQAARISLNIIDQTAPKVWMSRTIEIETYGHASAQHPFLLATSPGNTLDVAATGEAGIDFDNAKGSHPTVPTVTTVTNDVGITQAGADKVWSSAARTLTSFGSLVADVWANGTRTLTGFGTLVSDIWSNGTRTLTSLGSSLVAEIWNALTSGMSTAGSIGKKLSDWVVGNVLQINSSATAATKLAASANTIVTGAAISGTLSQTEMTTNLTETRDDQYNGRRLIFTSGILKDLGTAITDYDGATKKLTFVAANGIPSDGDGFNIV